MAAHERFLQDAKNLTDADLVQLAIVNLALSERARAKRAGFVEAEDADDARLKKALVTMLDLVRWKRDVEGPFLDTHRYRIQQYQARVEALETRVLELEAQRAADRAQQ